MAKRKEIESDQIGKIEGFQEMRIQDSQACLCVIINNMTKLGANFAIFILFFGIALIEAFQKQNWLEAGLFFALGIMSLWADLRKS